MGSSALFFGQFVCFVVPCDVHVGFDFLMVMLCDDFLMTFGYDGNEEFVWMIV